MKLTLIDRANDLQLTFLRIEILPFESDLLRTDRGHSNKPGRGGDRLVQAVDQQGKLIACRELLLFLDSLRRKIRMTGGIGRDVSVLHSGNEDRAQSPFQILEGLNRLAFVCLLVDEPLYRLRSDFRHCIGPNSRR